MGRRRRAPTVFKLYLRREPEPSSSLKNKANSTELQSKRNDIALGKRCARDRSLAPTVSSTNAARSLAPVSNEAGTIWLRAAGIEAKVQMMRRSWRRPRRSSRNLAPQALCCLERRLSDGAHSIGWRTATSQSPPCPEEWCTATA